MVVTTSFQKKQQYVKRLLEVYTRRDISCGSALCQKGCDVHDGIRSDVRRYVFPDRECIELYLDCFELASFDDDGVILLRSQLNLIGTGKVRLLTRLRSLYRDKRRNVFMFDDLHHEELQGGDSSRIDTAASWYRNHLSSHHVECIPLNSRDRIHNYFTTRWKDNDTVLNVYESQRIVADNMNIKRVSRSITDALNIEQGIEQGRYVRGVLRVDPMRRDKALVVGDVENVYVIGREDRWHAIHGDHVVVELYDGGSEDVAEHEDGEIIGLLGYLEDSIVHEGKQWKSRVVHISESTQRPDVLVSIAKQDEDALKKHQQAVSSVLCIPFDSRYPIMRLKSRYVERYVGKRLLVRIIGWDDDSAYPDVHILQVVGLVGDLQTERNCILHRHGLNFEDFSKAVLGEVPFSDSKGYEIPEVEIDAEIAKGRTDLRSHFVVSIDPPGCTDVDDAFHVKVIDESTFELGIHIADVTYYVKRGSLLDEEAAYRSTTVYLVDQRLNMLPSSISEDAASLLCGKPRFAVSVVWKICRKSFEIIDVWFGRSVIQSRYQMEYMQAQSILNGSNNPQECGTKTRDDIDHLRISLELVQDLAWKRLNARLRQGAIELDSKEMQFEMDEQGMPRLIREKKSVSSMKIVAELMILANEAVGHKIKSHLPTTALLRCHESPTNEKLQHMREFCSKFKDYSNVLDACGYDVFTDAQNFGKDLQKLVKMLSHTRHDDVKSLLQIVANRCLSEARYVTAGSAPSLWHFGLAIDCYTHFTSPIRRYSDIIVHRQLLDAIGTTSSGQETSAALQSKIETMNRRNRDAKLAQRECSLMYLLVYLSKHPQKQQAIVQNVNDDVIHVYVPGVDLKARIPVQHHGINIFDTVSVLLTANISSYHGPCLEASLMEDGGRSIQKDEPAHIMPAVPTDNEMIDEGASILEDTCIHHEIKEDESLTSLLHALCLSKENWTKKSTLAPRSYVLQGALSKPAHPTWDGTRKILVEATQSLLKKSRAYTTRAARFSPGSDQNVYWISLANQAATNADNIQASLYNL